jgi:hypothetical protein
MIWRKPTVASSSWRRPCGGPSAPLTDGIGSVLDREVYFPLAGYAGPGFHTWPSGHIPQATDPKPRPRIRSPSPTQKTFGETFGAATGVSDPRLQGRLCRRNGFFWAGFRATGSRGVLTEEKLKAGIRKTDNSKPVPRLPAGFFLTRRRGERGGRKIGFSPRAPRLRVNRGFACSKDVR